MVKKQNILIENDLYPDSSAPLTGGVDHMSFSKLLFKSTWLAILIFLGMLFITLLIGLFVVFLQANRFVQQVPLSWQEIISLARSSQLSADKQQDEVTNFLILGTDTVPNKPDAPILTDTIILVSLNLKSGHVSLLSLPRDLWSSQYQTRINALYFYGQEKYPSSPEQFPTDVIARMTGVPINYTLLISLDTLSQLVDVTGGVDIEVLESFTDEQFPLNDVDVSLETDPAKLYKTISFSQGWETMSGERVLEYIRSRYSNGDTGTDLNRSQRQQVVIAALINKLRQPNVLLNPDTTAQIYLLYDQTLIDQIPLTDVVALAKALIPVRNSIQLIGHHLSIYPDDQLGSIEHPPIKTTQGQWIYQIRDLDMFQKEIYDKLSNK